MNKIANPIKVHIIESKCSDDEGKTVTVFGISASDMKEEKIIPDISCDKSKVEIFAQRLRRNSFSLDSLFDLTEDFVEEIYGFDPDCKHY